MYRQKSSVYSLLSLFAICFVLMISSCSGDSAQQSGDPGAVTPGTGGIDFQIVWQQPPSSAAKAAQRTPSFNSCSDFAIDTIVATVSNGATIVASSSWPCSLHRGLVVAVPAGSNYTLQVNGLSSGLTTWSGLATSLTVTVGQVTNAGTIVMSYIGGDTTQPTVDIVIPYTWNFAAGATTVPVTDRFTIVFSKSMAVSTITSTNITLNNGSVPGTVSYDSASKTAAFIPSSALAYDTQYVLQVVACVTGSCITDLAGNQLLSSSYTNTFTTESAPIGTANAPTGLTTKPGNGQITLDWLAVNGAESYNVYYDTLPGVTTASTQLLGVRAPAVHLGLANNTTYYYIVTAVSSTFGESLASAESSTTPTFPAGNPLPPVSISVNFNGGASPYTITWPTVNGMSYNLYWSTGPIYPDHTAADNVIRYVPGGQYIHDGVTTGLTYCYIVTAMNSAGESADSMQVCGGPGSIQIFWP